MIISDKLKCIFIKVPKNASTSMEAALLKADPDCIISDLNKPPYGHELASQVRKIAGEQKWNEYFKFAFVREPKSRFISHYVYNLKATFNAQTRLHWMLGKDLKLISSDTKTIDKHMFAQFHIYDKYWCLPYRAYQQSTWIDEDIWLGDIAKIEEDWNYVCQRLGTGIYLPMRNETNSQEWRLDEDAEQLVNIFYKEDFDLYKKVTDNEVSNR